ncbi:MAG: polysaccharide biosynthesis protein [Bacteroidales bacterium]|jgi:UDP-glucose 4-epimerase|nr:polysaccharide biosynthesis protein [Bacteroidales bacterium]
MFKNKILLITGGTGSFGNAVLNRFLDTNIKEIRIFSRDEKKQDDMRHAIQNPKVKFYIGNVRDKRSVDNAMRGVDYIFHAAALKQVPSCEFFPIEAVNTNVLGTQNVLDSAVEFGVKNVVVLSTDKAAYPINAMGISKAMMEKVAIAKARSLGDNPTTTICCTRYGNVMASRGSVIPLFIDQIKAGKDLTITDPNMTRFMMTLNDAVDLVLYAFEHGNSGDLFIQKAPAATIDTLANAILELYKSSSKIKIIGTRHGEKLYESLVTREEMAKAEDMGKYYRIPCDSRDLNYDKYFIEGKEEISEFEDYHSHNTKRLSMEEMKELLLKLDIIHKDIDKNL